MAGPPGPTGGCRILLLLFISIRSRGESLWTGLPSFCDTKIAVQYFATKLAPTSPTLVEVFLVEILKTVVFYSFSDPDSIEFGSETVFFYVT